MSQLLRALLHLSPLVPLALGRQFMAVALLLFILLCYIKVYKLKQQLADLAAQGGDPKLEASLHQARSRWLALTYLGPA